MNQDFFYKLVSGHNKGLFATFLKILLTVTAQAYSFIIGLRNVLYNKQILKTHRHDAAVISIGNITLGGTGKTPLVIWLCNLLQERKINCAILTRGYKTTKYTKLNAQNRSDEPAILTESCPQAALVVNPDRVAGATEAIGTFGAKALIMDDGFQHRRLARDLDIVAIDATRPFGYDKIFPAGLLREPVTSLRRADAVVITRCDQIGASELDNVENRLRVINPDMVIARSIHAVVNVKTPENKNIGIKDLHGKKIFAFCGIGNPNSFLKTIEALGADLAGSKIYNDHHRYTKACLDDIYEQARTAEAEMILTTQKDRTKIERLILHKKDITFAYLAVEIKFLAGEDQLRSLIENTLAGKISEIN